MNTEQAKKIEQSISEFIASIKEAMSFRIKPWGEYASVRQRSESMAEQMVDSVNVATDLEEKLVSIMVLQQYIHMMWDQHEARVLRNSSSQQYVSSKAKLSHLIENENFLFQLKSQIDVSVESGKRAIDRLHTIQQAASRAAGISYA